MRKLATFAGAFAAGIACAQYALPRVFWLPLALLCLLAAFFCLFKKDPKLRRLQLLAIGCSAALFYNFAYFSLVQMPAEALEGEYSAACVAELCGEPQRTEYGAKVVVRLLSEHRLRAVYYGDASLLALSPGDRLVGGVYLASSSKVSDTDISTFTSKGIFLFAYNRSGFTVEKGTRLRYLPQRIAKAVRGQIESLYSDENAGFMQAILTGDKTGLSTERYTDLAEVGILHITAVSGLHCAFLLSLIAFFVGKQHRKLLSALAIPILLLYMLMVGCTPSVVRACVMLILLLIAPLLGREGDSPTSLALALLLILLQNPFAIKSVSLQLSFGAVAGILFLTPRLYHSLIGEEKRGKIIRFLATSFATTMGALVFTVPLTAYYFNILPLIAPLANILCLWAASLCFMVGLVSVLLGFLFPPLGGLAALVSGGAAWYILNMAQLLAQVPYHAVYFSNPLLKYWLVYVYALFAAAYWMPKEKRKYLACTVLSGLMLLLCVKLGALTLHSGSLDIIALDVGQGESVLMTSGGETALMDCGSINRWLDAGDTAADMLASIGAQTLDYLVLSHYHEDHADGIAVLINRVKVNTLLLPDIEDEGGLREELLDLAEKNEIQVRYIRKNERFPLGAATLALYPPLGSGSTNEEGLTLLCSLGDFDFLVTGDMDGATEKKLVQTIPLPDIEAMMVGHHGSRKSSVNELLETLTPEAAIISVGHNSYGHPTPEAMRRLVRAGATVYRTDLQGNIHISVK